MSHMQDPNYKYWIRLSKSKAGVFCKACVLFGSQALGPGQGYGKGTGQKLTTLVTKPLTKFWD